MIRLKEKARNLLLSEAGIASVLGCGSRLWEYQAKYGLQAIYASGNGESNY